MARLGNIAWLGIWPGLGYCLARDMARLGNIARLGIWPG